MITCNYCNQPAVLVTGKEIYPHRKDLHKKKFWVCEPCNARCGCHGDTEKPLGRLANAELRSAKMKAHAAFDTKWKSGQMRRSDAYKWLADQLGIKVEECHIGMFDNETCLRVVKICNN